MRRMPLTSAIMTSLPSRIGPPALIAAFVTSLGVACMDMRDELELQRALAAEFGTPETGINLANGTVLTVTLQNSPLADASGEDRRQICRRVAEYVRDHYRGYAALRTVQVTFASQRRAGPVAITSTDPPCAFSTSDLGAAPAAAADSAGRAAAR
jgi:hypothetical protein